MAGTIITGTFLKSRMALAFVSLLFAAAACTQGISQEEAAAKDREIATLQTRLASAQQSTTYWEQLVALMQPVSIPSMTDHRAYMLPSGVVLALHFDNMDLGKAKNLNWVAWGVPGTFCKSAQGRLENQYGPGFTHFHDMRADTHGGRPGAEGVWFVHTAVREFDAPWGRVKPGVDAKFMPTPPPDC